ncbi:vinexin-like isoform X2 [Brienomyrus brachyistius]|uniref:vinexin-like isoform X2 n=1 Tax=Brienomyrus brachyistius TaxID=42636 RepID=UPI0020B3DD23|nr:vinexin-like isoform X2 [Brienomyrus brachyistius]XP_048875839.1 vinexin-like isoform X2 [Brienomyrus brachyistius]
MQSEVVWGDSIGFGASDDPSQAQDLPNNKGPEPPLRPILPHQAFSAACWAPENQPVEYSGIGSVDETGMPTGPQSSVKRRREWYRTMFKQIHRRSEELDLEDPKSRSLDSPTSPRSSSPEDSSCREDSLVRGNISSSPREIPPNRGEVTKPASLSNIKLEWGGALDGLNMLTPALPLARPRASSTEVNLASELSQYEAELDSDIQVLERRLSQKQQRQRQPGQGERDRSTRTEATWREEGVHGASSGVTGVKLLLAEDRGVSVSHSSIRSVIGQKTDNSPVHDRGSPNTGQGCTEIPSKPREKMEAARAKFHFQAQSPRELTLQKGDVVYIHRQVDANWYQGEHHGRLGLFPANYVEILPPTEKPTPTKAPVQEVLEFGEAVALYNFKSDLPVELPLRKGERVCVLRRVDSNWLEGKLHGSNRTGIFPSSYVQVTKMPLARFLSCDTSSPATVTLGHSSQLPPAPTSPKGALIPPVSAPPSLVQPQTTPTLTKEAPNHMPVSIPGLTSTTLLPEVQSMQEVAQHRGAGTGWGSDTAAASSPALRSASSAMSTSKTVPQILCCPQLDFPSSTVQSIGCDRTPLARLDLAEHGCSPIHLPTYKAIYDYMPQKRDELELREQDVIRVLERCEDGWFVGISERTEALGTFPGNYVIPQ